MKSLSESSASVGSKRTGPDACRQAVIRPFLPADVSSSLNFFAYKNLRAHCGGLDHCQRRESTFQAQQPPQILIPQWVASDIPTLNVSQYVWECARHPPASGADAQYSPRGSLCRRDIQGPKRCLGGLLRS